MSVGSDGRLAVRMLVRSPGFTAAALLTLALAVGANTVIFSALHHVVLRPLPFRDADRIVYLWHLNPSMGGIMIAPPRKAIDLWRQSADVFEAVIAYTGQSHVLAVGGAPEEIQVTYIGAETLPFFGVTPAIGRTIDVSDESPGAPRAALISDGLWRRRFNGDRSAIGRPITLGDERFVIAGVMPPRFALPMGSDVMWAVRRPGDRDTGFNTVARVKRGVTVEGAQQRLVQLAATVAPDPDLRGWQGHILTPAQLLGTDVSRSLGVLMGAVGVLLLIACANIASLVLSRNVMRRRELTLRSALGASRPRLVRQLIVEGTVLALAGGIAGVLLANWGLAALNAIRPRNLSALDRVGMDGPVLAFAIALSVLCALMFSVLPALRASRTTLADVLRTGRLPSAGAQRFRRVLVVAQVALACVLLVGAALLARSLQQTMTVEMGFNPQGLVAMRLSAPAARYPSADFRRRFFDDVLERVQQLPGVEHAAAGNGLPPEGGVMFGELEIEGRTKAGSSLFTGGYVTPGYFSTLGIPVLQGRGIQSDDTPSSEPVVVVSESFVKKHFPDRSPIGGRMRLSSKSFATIVGVVGDVKANSLTAASSPQLYYPRAQVPAGFGAIIVRAPGADVRTLADRMRRAAWEIDPRVPIPDVLTSAQVMRRFTEQSRFTAILLTAFAISGLALAVVGVYGVLMLYVGDRRYEFGIRLALGAPRGAVARMVMWQSLILIGGGAAIGLAAAQKLPTALQKLLYEVRPSDPGILIVAAAVVAVAGALAAWGPLRRALGLDPAAILRAE